MTNRPSKMRLLITAAVCLGIPIAFVLFPDVSRVLPDPGTASDLYILVLIPSLYFIPAMIAVLRAHNNKLAIFVLNLFLGWTIIGWVAALVWASTSDVERTARA